MKNIDKMVLKLNKLGRTNFALKSITKQIKNGNVDWTQESKDGCSLFEEAVYSGLDQDTLTQLFQLFIQYGMDINYRSSMYRDTYMHTLIEADDYNGFLAPFLYLGYENNFNPELKNEEGKTVWDCLQKPNTTKELNEEDVELCYGMKNLFEQREIHRQLQQIEKENIALEEEKRSFIHSIETKQQELRKQKSNLEKKLKQNSINNQIQKIKQKIDDLNA